MKYCNVLKEHEPLLFACIENRHWIRAGGRIYSPYEYAQKFGTTHIIQRTETTADPMQTLKVGLETIATRLDNRNTITTAANQLKRAAAFAARIRDYYERNMDEKLKQSLLTRVWVE